MHHYPRLFSYLLCSAVLTCGYAEAASITGRDFSIGLGFTADDEADHLNAVTWNDRETFPMNTEGSIFDPFTFTPTVTGALFSGRGPGFENRVLSDGRHEFGNTDNKVGFLGGDFEVAIEAGFVGFPSNVDFDNPGYRLEISITSISIYAGAFDGANWTQTPTLQWTETTPGHEETIGTPTALNLINDSATEYQTAANYTQVFANPSDYGVSISAPNDVVTRTFSLLPSEMPVGEGGFGPENWTIGDGFEVVGRVRLLYNAIGEVVPEATCDFNGDGSCDAGDIDRLVGEVIAETNGNDFDMTGDGSVNLEDLTEWLSAAASENGFAASYLLGDANLDGSVDARDLNRVGLNWNGSPNTWSGGDFLAAGKVNASSLNAIAINWESQIPMAAQAVPEPSSGMALLLAGLCLLLPRMGFFAVAIDNTLHTGRRRVT